MFFKTASRFLLEPMYLIGYKVLFRNITLSAGLYMLQIIYIYIYTHTKRITMCPPGYHHNGFMATPELGTGIRLYIIYIYIHTTNYTVYTHIPLIL